VIKLAQSFLEADREASQSSWNAVLLAYRLRAEFPRKAKRGQRGWEDFCRQVLGRRPQTIAQYVAAAEYCKEHAPDWERMIGKDGLPPYYLVAQLSYRANCAERRALHAQLFAGKYEAGEFLKACHDLAEIEKAWAGAPKHGPRGEAEDSDGAGKAPAAASATKPKQDAGGTSGSARPTDPSAKPENPGTAPTVQRASGPPLINTSEISELLLTLLPPKTRLIRVESWTDVTNAGQEASAGLVAVASDLRERGAIVIVAPQKGDGDARKP